MSSTAKMSPPEEGLDFSSPAGSLSFQPTDGLFACLLFLMNSAFLQGRFTGAH